MARQSKAQQATVERVMHEFKHGELETRGRKVENSRQAIAIALSEAGASNQQSPPANRKRLRHTKAKERKGETAMQEKEGKDAMRREQRAGSRSAGKSGKGGKGGQETRAQLYEEAKKRDIPGRSKMSKDELARALHG
jgi:hypothetical protein